MNNNEENKIVYLRLDDILPNRFQPREVFDETGLEELADSIKEHGVIQPIIVRQIGDKYELIAGERRSKASAMAGLTTIPAIIKNMDDKESAKVSLLENLQRKNLSAIEEARTYKRILELENLTQEDLAKTMGKSQPMIANKLRLLSLPEEVQDALIKNQISERHARSLLNVKDKQTQLMLLDRIRNERLTVRELDAEIKKNTENNNLSNQVTTNNYSSTNNFSNQNPFNAQSSMNYFVNQNNNNAADDSGTRQSYNNFGGNFNNMGLNDYKTSIGSNMFSNLPNNDFSQNQDYNFSNITSNQNENSGNVFMNSFNPKQELDYSSFSQDLASDQKNKNYTSLGSMFDDNQGNSVNQEIFNQEKSTDKDFFVSNLKENNIKPAENKFLPNFDNQFGNNNFSNEYVGSNDLNNYQDLNMGQEENSNGFTTFNQGISNSNEFTDFNNFSNFKPIQDINNSFNYNQSDNQGSLFNQPLNIVDVPNKQINSNYQSSVNNFEDSQQEDQIENENSSFDNPFDDAYENILFAKPVPVQEETSIENEPKVKDEVEVIGEDATSNEVISEDQKDKNQYIDLEPVRTIFDARGAVLELKKTTDRIKAEGMNMESEEIDYDDYYQIIIKIKK